GGKCADVERLDDARGGARQSMEDASLVAQCFEERLALLRIERGQHLEALHCDELAESFVNAAVDHAEAAVADDGRDAVLSLDGLAAEAEGIVGRGRGRHGLAPTTGAALRQMVVPLEAGPRMTPPRPSPRH